MFVIKIKSNDNNIFIIKQVMKFRASENISRNRFFDFDSYFFYCIKRKSEKSRNRSETKYVEYINNQVG